MAEKLWIVSLGMQAAEVKAYCFGVCGQILIGGLRVGSGVFMPCEAAECEYAAATLSIGEFIVPHEGERELVGRILGEVTDG